MNGASCNRIVKMLLPLGGSCEKEENKVEDRTVREDNPVGPISSAESRFVAGLRVRYFQGRPSSRQNHQSSMQLRWTSGPAAWSQAHVKSLSL